MLNNSQCSKLFCLILALALLSLARQPLEAACSGKLLNPLTDICWNCMFPMKIGSAPVTFGVTANNPNATGGLPLPAVNNHDPDPPLICSCPAPPPVFIRFGIGVSFWEPVRLAEVVRTPMCSPTLNGAVLGTMPAPSGTNEGNKKDDNAFYHVHWFTYPITSWLSMSLRGACNTVDSFDISYITELDPLWDDDQLSFLLNPEAILFANPIAQKACIADSVTASLSLFGIDSLFWCSGSQGSVYPLTGNHAGHVGGVDSSLAITHKMLFKLHRELVALDTSTIPAMCTPLPQPLLRKNQYKQQMIFPIPQTSIGLGFGAASTVWATGREFPYKGEDFSYLIWRKRTCCAF